MKFLVFKRRTKMKVKKVLAVMMAGTMAMEQ